MSFSRFLRWIFQLETIEMADIDTIKATIADINSKVDLLIAKADAAPVTPPDVNAGAALALAALTAEMGDVEVSLQAIDDKVTAALAPVPASAA